jgi:glyoxylase-like metal-dependent hydrolase (beta-lactamase superfamily II)
LKLGCCGSILAISLAWNGVHAGESAPTFRHQHIEPAVLVNPWNAPDETYVEPSATEKLKPGFRVAVPDFGEQGRWYVQRLTDRTYWMICNAFATTAFVGDKGVLLVDASNTVVPADMLAAIKRFTDLPVKALVYSHMHTDHVGGSYQLRDALKEQEIDLRIIASASAAREIAAHQNNAAPPTEVIPDGRSTFMFEGFEFVLGTPIVAAHSAADSYVLTPDGVIMYVDFNYPGRVPLGYISSSWNVTGWIDFLRHVLGEEWTFANLGHANIGYKRDILKTFDYLGDLYDAYMSEIAPSWSTGQGIADSLKANGPGLTAGVFWGNYVDQSAEIMARKVYPKWKHVAQSEVIRSHAYKVFEDSFLNYNPERGVLRPKFTPIAPRK